MSEEKKTKVKINRTESMSFKVDFGGEGLEDYFIDEDHTNEGEMIGPNGTRLLASAVLGCLASSFIFCLKKKNLNVDDLEAEAVVTVARNEKGFLRIKKIDVNIRSKINNQEARKRADMCKKMFEQYCTVTQSVREGINVEVKVDY